MASSWIWEIPWSEIQPDPQTIINTYVAKYSGKVIFDFVIENALPIARLAVLTGAITTGMLWLTCWEDEKNRSWILQVLAAIMTTGALKAEYAATKDLTLRIGLTYAIKNSLFKLIVWKAISNDAAVASTEKSIHTLCEAVNVLNGPEISNLIRRSIFGFSIATMIYFMAKKMGNENYRAKNDTTLRIMVVNVILAFAFGSRVQTQNVVKAMIAL